MRTSRPLKWIEEREAKRMLSIVEGEAGPEPLTARAGSPLLAWLHPLRLLMSAESRPIPFVRVGAGIRRGWRREGWRGGCC